MLATRSTSKSIPNSKQPASDIRKTKELTLAEKRKETMAWKADSSGGDSCLSNNPNGT